MMKLLPGIALFLADEGAIERAVTLYDLASKERFVSNSAWFEDVAGRLIAAAASSLPVKVVARAKASGRALDLWQTAADLRQELRERGWLDREAVGE
jgi:hypothetical protein